MFKRKTTDTSPLEQKLDRMLALQESMMQQLQSQSNNVLVLYRRTTALALMLETIAKKDDLKMPKIIRAEIDASLRPDEFEQLAKQDQDEFITRYGETTLKILKEQGMNAISRIGELTDTPDPKTIQ